MKFKGLTLVGMIGLVAVVVAIGYLMMVGLMWALQYLVNLAFDTTFDYNVWIIGAIAYILWALIRGK